MFIILNHKHHPVVVEKVHGNLPQTEEDGADSDHYDQVGDVGVGGVLLWLGHPQQPGQETVTLVDFKTLIKNSQ